MISWETFPPQADGAIGVFVNNPAYTNDVPDDYIYNCDGTQAAFIFNDPGLALFQDYDAVDSTGAASHAFSATFRLASSTGCWLELSSAPISTGRRRVRLCR